MFRALPVRRINHSVSPDWSLDQQDIAARHNQYGWNDILEKSSHQWWIIVKHTALDPMIWFLLIASILFAMLNQYSNAIVLLFAIIPIGGMDAFLHWRTEISTHALSSKLITYAHVIRNGKEITIATRDLVPGDLVVVKANEYFPADGIIVAARNAQVDESSLTGEAFPVYKQALTRLPEGQTEPLIENHYWGLVGTRVLTGQILMRVVFTGNETLYGEIILSVLRTEQERTPLQKAIMQLVVTMLFIALIFCFILALVRYSQGFGIIDALLSATTLAVAALPDEFPMVFTFFLGVGVYRLAKKHALVRRAVSVENIGRINCICTDKTGTITEGSFVIAKTEIYPGISKDELLTCATLASRAESGDPLDLAILQHETLTQHHFERLKLFPFTEERKRETAIYSRSNEIYVATKGAPEVIFQLSNLTSEKREYWRNQVDDLARHGYKIIACADAILNQTDKNILEPESHYRFLGLIAFEDPPRKEVFEAIRICQENHIHVLMITGDHPITAKKIATDIGLGDGVPDVITAAEAEVLMHQEGSGFLHHTDVIARAVPGQKFDIVKALKKEGNIVAVTGDGVNDVPALRAADVGIAMGERGTQSAREAASIILLDDNFESIVNAIREGRQLFKNLQLSFKYIIMIHTPYVLSATIIPLLGFPLLYYPIHIVWIELFIHPTCMLVFQDLPSKKMLPSSSKARRKITFFNRLDWLGIFLIGFYTTSLAIVTYLVSLHLTHQDDVARADAFTSVGLTHIALTIGLSRLKSLVSRVVVGLSILMLLFLVQVPPIAHYFVMQPPSLATWGVLSALSLVTVLAAYLCS